MSDTVTITKTEYDRLIRAEIFLETLTAGGVDNWEWYDDACQEYHNILREKGMEPDNE